MENETEPESHGLPAGGETTGQASGGEGVMWEGVKLQQVTSFSGISFSNSAGLITKCLSTGPEVRQLVLVKLL